jgi:hypothetical protein
VDRICATSIGTSRIADQAAGLQQENLSVRLIKLLHTVIAHRYVYFITAMLLRYLSKVQIMTDITGRTTTDCASPGLGLRAVTLKGGARANAEIALGLVV